MFAEVVAPLSSAGGMLKIVDHFGLNDNPHLHAVIETEDVIKQQHVAAVSFYHCDRQDLFRQHKGEQKELKTWREHLGHHVQSVAHPALADGASTIQRFSQKAAVDQSHVHLRTGDLLMCNMDFGVRLSG